MYGKKKDGALGAFEFRKLMRSQMRAIIMKVPPLRQQHILLSDS
jgi:hypothetical protein